MQNDKTPCNVYEAAGREEWTAPRLQVHSISQITQLGFATNCDGGFGLPAIDGDAVFCRRRR